MLTLTLAVEDYFKPERSVPMAAGPALAPLRLPAYQNTDYFSKSTLDLSLMYGPAPTKEKEENKKEKEEKEEKEDERVPLRKLKLSLKLPSLTRCILELHILPKLVRFASRLENVKMFDGRELPAAVLLQNTPLGLPTCEFGLDDYFSAGRNFTALNLHDDYLDLDLDLDTFVLYTSDRQYKVTLTNFAPPKNLYDRQHCPVYLQHATLGSDKKSLVLLVMCQNLAFEKRLAVKLTFNNWQSTLIFTTFSHVKSFLLVNFDQFKFVIPLAHLPSALNAQFCIKYEVNSAVHWDNNSSKNYNMVLALQAKPPVHKDTFTYKAPTFNFTCQPPKKEKELAPASSAFAPLLAHVPKSSPAPYNYNELVSKLISVKRDAEPERPKLNHSASAPALRPRFSQLFMAKNKELPKALPLKTLPLTSALPLAPSLGLASLPAPKASAKTADPAPGFLDAKFNSTSYAALLQNYCFSGSASSLSPDLHAGSLSNSRSNSSSSIASDFMTPAGAFHSLGDTIHI